jgi:hypothetical protein
MSSILTGGRRRTAWQPLAEVDWSRGMIRDAPRDAIGKSGVYDSADFLLHQQGFAFKRGGTSYAGPPLSGASATLGVVYAQYPAGAKLVATGTDGHAYTVTAGSTVDVTGAAAVSIRDNPKLRVGGGKNLLIFPNADGVTAPTKYDGSANTTLLAGSPPAGRYAAIYKTRLVLGNSAANPNRLFFSPTPDIEATWDTANAWIDCDYMVTGLAAMHNMLLIFSLSNTERIIGSTPPPGSDMDRAPVGSTGCTDARSIVVQEGSVIFANPRGVYMTNGAGFASLTTEGLIESYWQTLLAGYDRTTWVISAGVYRSFYIVSITNGAGANVATLMCNIPKRAWWRLTNLNANMWGNAVVAQEELYYADRSSNRVVAISGIFTPTAANKLDANGTPVTPLLEMRMVGEGTGLKAYGDAHLTYDMRDAAADSPTLAVSAAPGVEALNFAALTESPLPAVTNATRRRLTVSKDTQGLSLRLAQTGPSAKTELYAVEQLFRPYTLESQGQ